MSNILSLLNKFEDHRDQSKIRYPLASILFISICAIFCGSEGWEDFPLWAETHKKWLAKYIDMSHGIPSYSTFRRIFMIVKPVSWGKLLQECAISTCIQEQEDQVAIDGKTMRGSGCQSKKIRPIQMVSAYSVVNSIILGEVAADKKSNEVKAIPLLLDLLELEGATITIDAIGCNKNIIQKIVDQGAHYVIGLKENQPKLYGAVVAHVMSHGINSDCLIEDEFDETHGRCVRRRCFAIDLPEDIKKLGFHGMNTVIATETIASNRYDKKAVQSNWRYHITDHGTEKVGLQKYVRNHWAIESMHWMLDVHMNDDNDRKYEKNAAENFAKTKRLLLNMVKKKPFGRKKLSVRSRLKRVGWDLDYLFDILFN